MQTQRGDHILGAKRLAIVKHNITPQIQSPNPRISAGLPLGRQFAKTFSWTLGEASLAKVANVEKKMPRSFITKDGFGITQKARDYLQPLIMGEDYPPYKNGIPLYPKLKIVLAPKKLDTEFNG